jgi:glycosyltransferase involved in cell wall biosynthesis
MLSVTAIVPTCERPLLLERALRSIAAQEFAAAEVIVVDDAAGDRDDATRRAVKQSGLGNVRVVANSRGKGASGARNTGAELAAGELLAFLDDDDEWLPSYLSEGLGRFELSDLDIVCADLLCQFEDGVDRPAKTAPNKLLPELFLTRNPGLGGSNVIIRRCLYREIGGFDESLLTSEDMDLGLRLSLRGEVKYERLPKRLVRFHQHKGGKLCTPAGDAMRAGIRRFYELHAHRMTEAQREEFRSNARRFWGIDEHGQILDLPPTAFFESLHPVLKAWLDQQRRRPDK